MFSDVQTKLCVVVVLAFQALVLSFMFMGCFKNLYAGSPKRISPESSVEASVSRGYRIRHDFSDKALRMKVKQRLSRSNVRVLFFVIAVVAVCINANAVLTHALESDNRKIDAIWNWVELIAFLYTISGMSNVRNTHTRLEHLLNWTQRVKAFSLMQYITYWQPGTLWSIYTQAKLARESEGKDPRRALIPVAWSLVFGILGLIGMMMKIRQVSFCTDREPWQWNGKEILMFIAFCNNVGGIVDTKMERMDAVLVLLFGGVDAEIVPEERGHANEVYDQIFEAIWVWNNSRDVDEEEGLSGFDRLVLAFTFGGADLQKLLVEELEYEPPPTDGGEGGERQTPQARTLGSMPFSGGLRNYAGVAQAHL